MGAVKHSRQRDAIKTFLMSRKDHPTADVVYTFVKNDFPSIVLAQFIETFLFLWSMAKPSLFHVRTDLCIMMPTLHHICIFSAESANV